MARLVVVGSRGGEGGGRPEHMFLVLPGLPGSIISLSGEQGGTLDSGWAVQHIVPVQGVCRQASARAVVIQVATRAAPVW
jgi:hypothetical protein